MLRRISRNNRKEADVAICASATSRFPSIERTVESCTLVGFETSAAIRSRPQKGDAPSPSGGRHPRAMSNTWRRRQCQARRPDSIAAPWSCQPGPARAFPQKVLPCGSQPAAGITLLRRQIRQPPTQLFGRKIEHDITKPVRSERRQPLAKDGVFRLGKRASQPSLVQSSEGS
jgi:hypothetical protein